MSGIKVFGVGCSNIRLGSIIESSEFIQDGLILHLDASNQISYPGSGTTWYDLSTSSNDVTLRNNVVYPGSYFTLDGDNDYIDFGTIPVDDELQLSSDFTLSFWINWSGAGDDYQRILDKGNASNGGNGFAIFINDVSGLKKLRYHANGLSTAVIESTDAIPINQWVEYTYTYNSATDTISLYKNGVFDKSTTFTGNPNVSANMRFGTWYALSGREFRGSVGLVCAYNRSLSSSEVLSNHQVYNGVF